MNPKSKILIGALMIVAGIYWYSRDILVGGLNNLQSLAILVKGSLGAIVFLIGVFVVWIESDELKMRKERKNKDFEPEEYKEEEEAIEETLEEEGEVELEPEYEKVVEGTIDEVKEKVEEKDLEPKAVLEAEKEKKDRKTLKSWLEARIDE
ncbi:MAG: hypothetical protein MUP58_01475 [Candidatus Nanohaloarchaeota archaeon QJJ-9]|nr:hypothetical protein [Candidatus Nanohaloarchaeota archaeon QJJ-9]